MVESKELAMRWERALESLEFCMQARDEIGRIEGSALKLTGMKTVESNIIQRDVECQTVPLKSITSEVAVQTEMPDTVVVRDAFSQGGVGVARLVPVVRSGRGKKMARLVVEYHQRDN